MKTFGRFSVYSLTIGLLLLSTMSVAQVYRQYPNPASIPRYGTDSVACMVNLSLYREFVKQYRQAGNQGKVIEDAIAPWRYVMKNCPKSSENLYVDGIIIFEYLISNTKDASTREKYVDTLLALYDQRIVFFNKEGEIMGRKGEALTRHRPEATELIYKTLQRSVDLQGIASLPPMVVHYFRSAEKMTREEKITKDQFFTIYEKSIALVDANLVRFKDNAKELPLWENVKSFIEQTVEPYATCTDLVSIFTRKLNETPNDIDLLYKIIKLFDRKGCVDQPLYLQATLKAYELDPSPQSAFAIGRMYFKNKEYSKAVDFLKEADKLQNPNDKADGFLLLAHCFKSANNNLRAREAALKAIEARPAEGNAYILIGDLYAENARECGTNELTTGAVYWAAVDKYMQARANDPSVGEIASSRIAVYSRHFPSHETIFFYGLKEGDNYRVECWINENTSVRPARK